MSKQIAALDEGLIRTELKELVRQTAGDTPDALLDEETDQLVGADRYERTESRKAYRSGHYTRGLTTTSGQVELNVPKPGGATFQTAVIERYRRREASIEEALVEMYLAGVSTRRVEDITEALWGASAGPATVSNLNERAFAKIEEWRTRPLEAWYPYAFVDGTCLKRSWGGSAGNVAVMVAIGVNGEGYREVIGCAEGFTETPGCWEEFLPSLRERGAGHVGMPAGDKCAGMVGSLARVFPKTRYQRCAVHFHGSVTTKVPQSKRSEVQAMLSAIHAMEDRRAAQAKAEEVAAELERMKLKAAAKTVREGFAETPAYMGFPRKHWKRIRTNNAIERLNREVRRRTDVVGAFPDGHAAPVLAAARARHESETSWGARRYLDATIIEALFGSFEEEETEEM